MKVAHRRMEKAESIQRKTMGSLKINKKYDRKLVL